MAERGTHALLVPGKRLRALVALLAITIVGAALRLWTVTSRGLWLDEASQIGQFNGTVWDTIVSQVGGTHPPLYHICMHFWTHWFGTSEFALRSMSLCVGVVSIPVAYWAATTIYDRRVGLLTATVVAFSPYHIWYSQEARMYSMMFLFGLLSLGTFVIALRENTFKRWLIYGIVTLFGLFTQYFFLLLLGGQFLYYFFVEFWGRLRRMRAERRSLVLWRKPLLVFQDVPTLAPWLITYGILAACVILWMDWAVFFPAAGEARLVSSLTHTGLGYGAPPPSLAPRFNDIGMTLVEVISGFHAPWMVYALVAMWPLLIYAALLALGKGRAMRPESSFLLFSMISGTLVIWSLGQWQGVVLLSRYLMAMSTAGAILVGVMLDSLKPKHRYALLAVALVIAVAAWFNQSTDGQSMGRYQNREAFTYVAKNYQPGDVVLYEPFYIDDLANYYLPKDISSSGLPMFSSTGVFRDTSEMMGQDLDRIVGPARRVWVVRGFQNVDDIKANARKVSDWFASNGYRRAEYIQLNKVEILRFEGDGSRKSPFTAVGQQ
ncbi:MAG TPA: glycosyltransferase family 39 protein [Coriobacteriia bacterium]|nr:glycosyltransferase family 39 protein [Coriobacteriia bacterium]